MNNSRQNTNTPTTVQIPNYQIKETIYSGSRTLVYRAIRTKDQLPVVIKLLKNDYPTFSELVQFRNQYTIAKNLNSPLIIQTYSLKPYQNGYALVMEDFGGISLHEWAVKAKNALSLREFLVLAIAICNTLDILYRERIIHKDIKPSNILINPETKEVKLIDFSIASLLPRETQTLMNPNVLEGTLAYISPEQTGRMNRGIDYRTDFYSLGITFYELLTGKLPFPSNNPMELVHSHIAKASPLVHEINSEIPSVISEIVNKLMAKNAEDRYQSALGLKLDLETCLHQLQETGEIQRFEIARRDVCDRFIIPDKLYGRETEVSTVLQAFERVSLGATEMMLVAGFSGIGKTAVVNEVHKPIVRQRGYFIKGKFDQFNRNIPFSTFVQAFRDLMGQLLSESDTELQIWKTQILQALGDNGQVIIEVIPELERIVGKQAPVTELSGTAAQNRFNLLFQKFIQVFTTKEHPLVMFLDDLQWADSASLNLMQLLMNELESGYLLVIGAYRDHEVSLAHPLMLTLDAIAKANATINTITLRPLSQGSLNQLVADTLNCHILSAQALSELIALKTKGNPFFATQFLKALYQDGLIQFDLNLGHWQCDIARVRTLAVTDDVVEFMASQLQKLPNYTQDILKLAACIGAQFDLQTLAIVSQQSESDAAVALWKALQEGLIFPQSEIYKFYVGELDTNQNTTNESLNYEFLHDRVQQAAYSLIPELHRQATHRTIGQQLLRHIPLEQQESRIFEIVNQLNAGIEILTQQPDKDELARLNSIAGRKAKASAAYEPALKYSTIGLNLLTPHNWQSQYELLLGLYELAAEAAYLTSNYEQMEQFAQVVLNQTTSLLDRIRTYEVKIQACMAQNQQLVAIDIAKNVLQQLGVDLPAEPTMVDIGQGLQEIQTLLAGKLIGSLLELPKMIATEKQAAMQILSSIISATYQAAPNLLPLVIFAHIKLSVQYGNAPESTYGYVMYGLMLLVITGDIDSAYEFGKLGINLLDCLDASKLAAKTIFGFNCTLRHWKEPLKNCLEDSFQAHIIALETGDIEYAGLNLVNCSMTGFCCGRDLVLLNQEMEGYYKSLHQLRQYTCLYMQSIHCQAVVNLIEAPSKPCILLGDRYDEDKLIPLHLQNNELTTLYHFYVVKLVLSYLFQEYEQAREYTNLAQRHIAAAVGIPFVPIFYFYDSLTHLAIFANAPEPEQAAILERVNTNQEKIKFWADNAPTNNSHRYQLIEAERYRVLGNKTEAIEHYDRAVFLAKENGYVNEEALANELAAKFYLNWGKEKVAASYMQEAYYSYARWGAKAKTDDLETRYPQLLRPILEQSDPSVTMLGTLATIATPTYSNTRKSSSSSSINTTLDFAAILKASQALARTLELEDLLYQLTQIILQNSGGDRCALILPNENAVWQVRAIATKSETELYSDPLDRNPNVPVKLIQYVKNTQQVVVIDDLETDLPVIEDYLRQHQPKSVLCLPILNQGNLVGILYLNNRLTSGVFTSDRILILNFLCTQAAISLENARLYSQVKQTLNELQQAQLQIVQSEKMSALGNLVAGVAHEINNPVGCIVGNVDAAQNYINDLLGIIDLYAEKFPQPSAEIEDELEAIDLDYVREDLPKLIKAMKDGGSRIKSISASLRTFSRVDSDQMQKFNLHEGIDSTVLILRHRLKANETRPAIEVVTDYGQIPEIACFPGQLNQVFMNILANAIDALDESNTGRSFAQIQANPNRIKIQTRVEGEQVTIAIADNGPGIPESVKTRIFDHLFTTKSVGKGTGLGLAIARQIIVEKHGGEIRVNSILGKGTEFVLALPLAGKS